MTIAICSPDVQGWDLCHFVRVKWYKPPKDIEFSKTLLARQTIAQVSSREVLDRIIGETYKPYTEQKHNFLKLKERRRIEVDDVLQSFVDSGVRIQDAENIAKTIARISKLARWYVENDDRALEHEIRTFLVVPLLISLGWSREQKIKIEYNKIDIAVFDKPFTKENRKSPKIIIETKRFQDGLNLATKAIKEYAKKYPDCQRLIATNGFRYKLFVKDKYGYKERGYFNLFDMREHYYLDKRIWGPIWCLREMSNV